MANKLLHTCTLLHVYTINIFTVVNAVTWPLNGEACGDIVFIETDLTAFVE